MTQYQLCKSIQATLGKQGIYATQTVIYSVIKEYREHLLNEILETKSTQIPGIGRIYAVKHKKTKVFGRIIKAHLCLKLRVSNGIKRAINEV